MFVYVYICVQSWTSCICVIDLNLIMSVTIAIRVVNKSVGWSVFGEVRALSCGTHGAGGGGYSGAAPSSLRGGPQRLGPPDEAGAR